MKLTQYSRGSGCGCKIAPTQLQEILTSSDKKQTFQNLLVGYETSDDAAVFLQDNNNCIISTTDFFTPIVDDPFTFGEIAAANAISDVYAMGGKPFMALGILGFPVEKFETLIAKKILEGARSTCNKAGIPLAGGHSIDSAELFFGLAVTGNVTQDNLKTNAGAKPNDVLFLTKPIGSGVLASALKRELINHAEYSYFIKTISKLNSLGAEISKLNYVHAITDVTGFGLLGHSIEMAKSANLCVELHTQKIPTILGFQKYTSQFVYPDNTTKNYNAYLSQTKGLIGMEFLMYCDPQTNGGLLISVAEEKKNDFLEFLFNSKLNDEIFEIGCFKIQSDNFSASIIN
jgi:selenide,water dikinase